MTTWEVRHGDCRDVMRSLEADSVDAIVSDPPYGLSFMGKAWDHGVPGVEFWTEALRVAKPGAHLVAFGGDRTWHRLAVAIEDAGWEIRSNLAWIQGQGFPKNLNVTKQLADFLPANAQCVCVQNSTQKAQGFQSDYPSCCDFGDGLLPVASNVDPSVVPSQDDVREHIRSDLRAGDSAVTQASISADANNDRLSTYHCSDQIDHQLSGSQVSDSIAFDTPRNTSPVSLMGRHKKDRRISDNTRLAFDSDAAYILSLRERYPNIPLCIMCGKFLIPQGLGTSLKPAFEPVILARKPLTGTVAANVTQYGTGAINVDGCRIGTTVETWPKTRARPIDPRDLHHDYTGSETRTVDTGNSPPGRWPANVLLDEDAAGMLGEPSRFFYTAKVSRKEREAGLDGMPTKKVWIYNERPSGQLNAHLHGKDPEPRTNPHPTVKPIALMRWLCRLVTPPGGLILDPFNGSGSTGCAAVLEGFRYLGAELEPEYVEIARRRIAYWESQRSEPDLFG